MRSSNELWEDLGDLVEDDIPHVLTRLFTLYEKRLQLTPNDEAAQAFFRHLSQVLEQVSECNLRRR